jgi:hypothetical protein
VNEMMCIIGYQLLSGFVLPGPRVETSGILGRNARRFPRFVGIGWEIGAGPERERWRTRRKGPP